MFDTYTEIFNSRGSLYHRAMQEQPLARAEEFQAALRVADLRDGHTVCDVPSGGGYLGRFVAQRIKLLSVETSIEFVKHTQGDERSAALLCEDLARLPVQARSVDRVLSLAGSHHLPDRPAFFRDVHRILRPAGVFCLADVRAGSGVDDFLNGFVDRHSAMGHHGDFVGPATADELKAAGFLVPFAEPIRYPWRFADVAAMVRFCRQLFGIDRASDAEILAAIEEHLGHVSTANGCRMNWELFFFKAAKPG